MKKALLLIACGALFTALEASPPVVEDVGFEKVEIVNADFYNEVVKTEIMLESCELITVESIADEIVLIEVEGDFNIQETMNAMAIELPPYLVDQNQLNLMTLFRKAETSSDCNYQNKTPLLENSRMLFSFCFWQSNYLS